MQITPAKRIFYNTARTILQLLVLISLGKLWYSGKTKLNAGLALRQRADLL